MPPNCRAECVVSSDCSQDKACLDQKCGNPCTPGTCANNAICKVVNHNPICSCSKGFTGNPFEQCIKIQSKMNQLPLPLNQFSNQSKILWIEFCEWNHFISKLNKKKIERKATVEKFEREFLCFSQSFLFIKTFSLKTQNFNHILATEKKESDWFERNRRRDTPWITTHPILHFVANYTQKDDLNPCLNNPCGPNSQCRVIGNQGACSCLPNYVGRPPNCRPECTSNAECASNKACINDRCIDPCIGKCGENAVCNVVKHNAECNCISGYEGDAFTRCTVIVVQCKNRNM